MSDIEVMSTPDVTARRCWGENIQTLEVEADTPSGAWAWLGRWAWKHPDSHIQSASMTFVLETKKWVLIAYYTEG